MLLCKHSASNPLHKLLVAAHLLETHQLYGWVAWGSRGSERNLYEQLTMGLTITRGMLVTPPPPDH